MPVKSIIDVEVNDGAFKRFADTFKAYEAAAKKMPKEWAAVMEQQKKLAQLGKSTVGHMEAQKTLLSKMNALEQTHSKSVAATERSWKNISSFVKSSSNTLVSTAKSIAGWGTAGAAAVLGGTVFGLDRMAGNVSSGRKSAMGLGVSYGQQKSFNINYDRLVGNSDQFLSSVNEAKLDPTKLGGLLAAGGGAISTGDVANKNPAQLAIQLISALKKKVDATPDQLLGSIPGASQFGDVAFLQRLKKTDKGELAEYGESYGKGVNTYNLQESTQKGFQDFLVKLDGAGQEIETVFVKGLEPLIGPINKMAHSLALSLKTLMESDGLKDGIVRLGEGIENVAKYLAGDQFQKDIISVSEDFHTLAVNLDWLISQMPHTLKYGTDAGQAAVAKAMGGGALAGTAGALMLPDSIRKDVWAGGSPDASQPGATTSQLRHNPGNLRSWGKNPTSGGFAVFPDDASGVRAIASQLKLYQGRGNDTAEGILSKYAPAGSDNNNTEAYIKDVIKRVGITRSEHLDFNKNPEMLAKFVAAITKHEGSKAIPTDTVVTILNNTGGNAVVTSSQLPH